MNKFMHRFGRISILTGIVTGAGYFIVKDLKSENSIIKGLLRKIPVFKPGLTGSEKLQIREINPENKELDKKDC